MHNLFVYGTLKYGFPNHHFLEDSQFLYSGFIRGTLLHLGGYPGLIRGTGQVFGEYYLVDDKLIPALDRLEGHPHLFERTLIDHENEEGPFTVYLYQARDDLNNYQVLHNGVWR